MAVNLNPIDDGRTLELLVLGKLSSEDYRKLNPEIERRIEQHGKIRLVVDMTRLSGVGVGAMWEDVKFDVRHRDDIERIAVIGDRAWMEWMTEAFRPFTRAEVRYEPPEHRDRARAWAAGTAETGSASRSG